MPLSNGLLASKAAKPEVLDYSKALEVLKADYPERDGLHIKDLLDTNKRGALTYNDILILPGYIGMVLGYSTDKNAKANRASGVP
jgi:IMP dehydrogenase